MKRYRIVTLTKETLGLVLDKLNDITLNYFTLEKGWARNSLNPLGKSAEQINWNTHPKSMLKKVESLPIVGRSDLIMHVPYFGHIRSATFEVGTIVYLGGNEIIFRSPEIEPIFGKFFYRRIRLRKNSEEEAWDKAEQLRFELEGGFIGEDDESFEEWSNRMSEQLIDEMISDNFDRMLDDEEDDEFWLHRTDEDDDDEEPSRERLQKEWEDQMNAPIFAWLARP